MAKERPTRITRLPCKLRLNEEDKDNKMKESKKRPKKRVNYTKKDQNKKEPNVNQQNIRRITRSKRNNGKIEPSPKKIETPVATTPSPKKMILLLRPYLFRKNLI